MTSLLSDDQFGGVTYTAPNKRVYTMRTQGTMVEALMPSGRAAGRLSWWRQGLSTPLDPETGRRGPEIHRVGVSTLHRRKGVATAMLEMARRHEPDLSHSRALSPEGAAWAAATPLPGDSEATKRAQRFYAPWSEQEQQGA